MLQINYDAIVIPYSDGIERDATSLMVIGRFSVLLHNRTCSTTLKALYSSVMKLEIYAYHTWRKDRHVTSRYITGIGRGQYKKGANKGANYKFWKRLVDPGLNLPVYFMHCAFLWWRLQYHNQNVGYKFLAFLYASFTFWIFCNIILEWNLINR